MINNLLSVPGALTLYTVTCGVDTLFSFYVFQMTSKLRIMSDEMKNLDINNYYHTIRDCLINYESLIKCRSIIETIYGPIILWTITTNAVVLCALIFQLSRLDSITIESLLRFLIYSASKITQTFLYGWSGTALTSQSEIFFDAVYSCKWTDCDKKQLKTSVLLLLCQKPIVIVACSISTVSVDMFIMVLNTSLSYFFLLKTMEEKTITKIYETVNNTLS
ncbi:odorant receptor 13a-like [Aphidius gifuensis]|uniref:odorant receptor 13a-like n=1 Tax=Aphidius gifuensis TaxID=684658 RepID=UPI001CDC823E|nr:odorant receptor 13a-like [Aphidius gifuensis]